MKVIFLEDIPSVARKYDVKDVRDGYARNFLLPRGIAEIARPKAMAELEAHRMRRERERSEAQHRYEELAEKLKGLTVTIPMKTGEEGTTFGSVNVQKIQEALKKEGLAIEKEWIVLDVPLKTIGEHEIQIHFPSGVKGAAKIVIEPENK